ncbi:hypothetical protein Tco_0492562 [Tanacetum coccineum]
MVVLFNSCNRWGRSGERRPIFFFTTESELPRVRNFGLMKPLYVVPVVVLDARAPLFQTVLNPIMCPVLGEYASRYKSIRNILVEWVGYPTQSSGKDAGRNS